MLKAAPSLGWHFFYFVLFFLAHLGVPGSELDGGPEQRLLCWYLQQGAGNGAGWWGGDGQANYIWRSTREPSVPMYHILKASPCVGCGKEKVILTLPSSCERECVEHVSKYVDYTGREGFVALMSGMCRRKGWSRLSQHTSSFVWVSQLMALLLKMLTSHEFL